MLKLFWVLQSSSNICGFSSCAFFKVLIYLYFIYMYMRGHGNKTTQNAGKMLFAVL